MTHLSWPYLRTAIVLLTTLGGAIILAHYQSRHDQETRAEVLASELAFRVGGTSSQLLSAYKVLAGVAAADACSPANVREMRRIALASPYLAGLGFVESNLLLCSTIGGQEGAVDLGPPDYISTTGYALRKNRLLESAPGMPLVVNTAPNGLSGFFIPSLLVPFNDLDSGISLGVVGYSAREPLMSSGPARYDWTNFRLRDDVFSASFVNQGHIFVVERSKKWDNFTYAAISLNIVDEQFIRLLPIYLILGLFLGIIISSALWKLDSTRNSISSLFKRALVRKEISVEFQPIVDLASGRWLGAEALARWRRENDETVSPDVFVSIAEQSGLICELTQTVLELSLRDMAPFLRAREWFFISFNVSTEDLRDRGFTQRLETLIEQYRLQPKNVHLEITERQGLDSTTIVDAVTELRSKGFEVGTDDFGVGYSNLI